MYELMQAADNTFYIDCPAKIGVYRLSGDKVILIDSGNDKEAGRKVLKILNENSWTLEAIVNTHSNADHIGGNRFLAERTGCRIYAKGIEKAFIEFPILEPSFLFGGFPGKPLRHKFLMAESSNADSIEDFPLPPGMAFFPLKGHFFDMIGLKTPDNVVFLADCVFSEAVLKKYPISFIYDVAGFLKTLDFIETLDGGPFIPSHTEPVMDIKPLAEINRRTVLGVIDAIKQICGEPLTFEMVLKGLFDRYGIAMDITQYALAGSTVRSYLSHMADSGVLEIEVKENRLLYKT